MSRPSHNLILATSLHDILTRNTAPIWVTGRRDSTVGTVEGETMVEACMRECDRTLVAVDYRAVSSPDAAIPARAATYATQLLSYLRALVAATGAEATRADVPRWGKWAGAGV